jgi:hypothetical protein
MTMQAERQPDCQFFCSFHAASGSDPRIFRDVSRDSPHSLRRCPSLWKVVKATLETLDRGHCHGANVVPRPAFAYAVRIRDRDEHCVLAP